MWVSSSILLKCIRTSICSKLRNCTTKVPMFYRQRTYVKMPTHIRVFAHAPMFSGLFTSAQKARHEKRDSAPRLLVSHFLIRNAYQAFLFLFLNSRLRRRNTSDRHTERRARYIVQADLVTELHGRRLTSMLATNTALQVRTDRATFLGSHTD